MSESVFSTLARALSRLRAKAVSVLALIYRLGNRVIPCDITHVMLRTGPLQHNQVGDKGLHQLDRSQFDSSTLENKLENTSENPDGCQLLNQQALEGLVSDERYQFSQNMLNDITTNGYRCYAALVAGTVAGYLLCGDESIPCKHNSGGSNFQGIGLQLPKGSGYVFKCLVLPEFRGQGILSKLLLSAFCREQDTQGIDCWVTTTDWTNTSALKAFRRAGFISRSWAAEIVIMRRRFFRAPVIRVKEDSLIRFQRPSAHAG